jgi:hypothetical protein
MPEKLSKCCRIKYFSLPLHSQIASDKIQLRLVVHSSIG